MVKKEKRGKMKKIANLGLEDAFAWGVCQKIRLTGDREISFEEIAQFAAIVTERAINELHYDKIWFNFSRDNTNKFLNEYQDYVTRNESSIRLNDGLSYEDVLEIFHMGLIPLDLHTILLDDEIGKQIFGQKTLKEPVEF